MTNIISKIISKIKGEDFNIDSNIPFIYLLSLILEKIIYFTRGIIKRIGLENKPSKFFVGKRVKLKVKSNIRMGNTISLGDFVEIDALSKNGVELGNNVSIGKYSAIKCTGTIKNIGKGIKIGNNFGCGDYCFFGAAGGIQIGNDVIMGQNVRFHSENHYFNDIDIPIRSQGVYHQGIKIGNNCWIGAGVVILDGVQIGDGCVIGANTLVNKDIPPYSIAVGNPVKIKRNMMDIRNENTTLYSRSSTL